ncbi:hypothetical protein BGZ95_011910 [Linnemannia exigua]|uniref:Uncharacterized protein n=1 Tax=Linnemannia exigua TaxID=604196 RepID=A0AAD4D994_9FUNG|nr:hypothetical protein BGZ95_011910 [Linnemannia exigua]
MASILFDDITFPRELYDPDTFEFVAPVSTLLTFTPHIISQLAKSSEEEQEPIPLPTLNTDNKNSNSSAESATASASSIPEQASKSSRDQAAESSSSSGGVFSSFKNFATGQGTQKIIENGLYLAGRYMDGSAAQSARSYSYENDYRYDTRSRQPNSSSSNYWFGSSSSSNRHEYRDQERQRLRDMEDRLKQMERDMRQQSAMARSEVDAQRRERVQLEQELESQKQKVKKLEKEVEQQQKEQEANKKKQEEEKKRQQEKEAADKKKKKVSSSSEANEEQDSESASLLKKKKDKDESSSSSSQEVTTTNNGVDTANAVLMATVGVASLVMSLYAAHKASATYSVVRFHDQLELLIEQCEGVIQSTEAWMSEQFLEVPDQIRQDLKNLKELIETIQRLDPRSEKKAETVAWSMSAVGSVGAVGGAVLGSMTAMASGGTLVVGCALYGIMNRARFNGPEYNAARSMMEVRAIQVLKSLGVNPNSSTPNGRGGGRSTSLIHESRLERLRIEFERREGLEMGDANEIDGLAVEEALLEASFSAPFVSQKSGRSRQQSAASAAAAAAVLEEPRPTLSLKSEPKRVSIHA